MIATALRSRCLTLCFALLILGSAYAYDAALGVPCNDYNPVTLYVINGTYQCCLEQSFFYEDETQCASYCEEAFGNGTSHVFGRAIAGIYSDCLCVTSCYEADLQQIVVYPGYNSAAQILLDLAAGIVPATIDESIGEGFGTNISLSRDQTAILRTGRDDSGTLFHFRATASIRNLTEGSISSLSVAQVFRLNEILDIQVSQVENSFEISVAVTASELPVQYKRQTASRQIFFSIVNEGSSLLVSFNMGQTPMVSWRYLSFITNTNRSVETEAENFVYDLEVVYQTSLAYPVCDGTSRCDGSNVLTVCNGTHVVEKRYCHMGCSYGASACSPCNSTSCQGTCVGNALNQQCECSGAQLGRSCSLDLSTSVIYLQGDLYRPNNRIRASFELDNCNLGASCGSVWYTNVRSCCSASLTLESLVNNANGSFVQFARAGEWQCYDEKGVIDTATLPSSYLFLHSDGYVPWTWADQTYNSPNGLPLQEISQPETTCDESIMELDNPSVFIPKLGLPLGGAVLAAGCAGVITGFLVGMQTAQYSRMKLLKKEKRDKGCVPKGTDHLLRGIIATISCDVGLVTIFNMIGVVYPVSFLVFCSGVVIVVLTLHINNISDRIDNKPKYVKQLRIVQNVFGRVGGAFLMTIGVALFAVGLSDTVGSVLAVISMFVGPYLGWIYLGLYITWVLVLVHFAAATFVCVHFYYGILRSQGLASYELTEPASTTK